MFSEDGMTHLEPFFNGYSPPSLCRNVPTEAQTHQLLFGDRIILINTRSQPTQLGPIGDAALNSWVRVF